MGHTDRIVVDGKEMDAYVALPAGAGKHPAIVYMHHRYGIETFARSICDRLAEAGFVAVAPDLFHRSPADADIDTRRKAIRDTEAIVDIGATIDHVAGLDRVRPKQIATVGHCMGGRMALVGASVYPAFRAAVALYGGNMFVPFGNGGPTAFDRLHSIRCPVAGFFGNDDKNPSPADVDRMDAELTRHGIAHVFTRYDGAGHGFAHTTIAKLYREDADRDSWERMVAFLNDAVAVAT